MTSVRAPTSRSPSQSNRARPTVDYSEDAFVRRTDVVIIDPTEGLYEELRIHLEARDYTIHHTTQNDAVEHLEGVLAKTGLDPVQLSLEVSEDSLHELGQAVGPTILGHSSMNYALRYTGTFNNNLVLGIILILFVLLVPRGIVPTLVRWWDRARDRRVSQRRELRLRRRRGASGAAPEAAP